MRRGWRAALVSVAALLAGILGVYLWYVRGVGTTPRMTTALGRDLLTCPAHGGRISFLVSGTAVVAHTVIGLAFPPLLFLILFTGMLGASLGHIILALSLVGWAGMARQVRAESLSLRAREFIAAARALGATDWRILRRHILPNVITVAFVRASLDVGPVILSEATLSFLGIGIQPPTPSWGVMIADGFKHLRTYPYQTLIPCITLSGAILALTFVGEGIAEALDPRWRRR